MHSFHPKRPLRRAALAALATVLLSGCGGGGGSSNTSLGFRFVPDGSGTVRPNTSVQFEYDPGSVATGVIVSVTPQAAGLPAPPPGEAAPQDGTAYQVTLTPAAAAFSSRPRVFVSYAAAVPAGGSPRVFLYDAGANPPAWVVLPLSAVPPRTAPIGTSAEALLPGTLTSGSYLAVFAAGPPIQPNPAGS